MDWLPSVSSKIEEIGKLMIFLLGFLDWLAAIQFGFRHSCSHYPSLLYPNAALILAQLNNGWSLHQNLFVFLLPTLRALSVSVRKFCAKENEMLKNLRLNKEVTPMTTMMTFDLARV